MDFIEQFAVAGEHALTLQGAVGKIEAILTVPSQNNPTHMVFLGHPHSLQGGTMNNKVVTTLARVFKELGIPSLRFNFRGVGESAGVYDAGIGESEDMLLLVQQWQAQWPELKLIFAGFSFGSYVAYRAAAQADSKLLITVAPAVHHYNYGEFDRDPSPWLVVQGEDDEVVPQALVFDFVQQAKTTIDLIPFANTGHFFHGKLIELKATLMDYISSEVKIG